MALQAGAAAPKAKAGIALYRVHGGTGVHLWAKGLQPGSKRVYEMLCGNEKWTTSAGTFRADAQRPGERAAHDGGTGRGIRPRERRH